MTTEMKQLLALLLMACAFIVPGDAEFEKDPCTNGFAAIRVYNRYEGCSGSMAYEYVRDLLSSNANNLTLDNLIRIFSNYCSNVFPKFGPCFQKNIENCTSSQRNTLMSLADHTGFACEPNTNRIHPVVQHLLSRLTSADLPVNDQCNEDEGLQTEMMCYNRSLRAIGLSLANYSEVITRLGVEELIPMYRTFVKTSVTCIVTHIRDNPEHCSTWRGKAIHLIRFYLLPTTLGNYMTFTTADIDIMFGWPVQFTG